MTRFDVLRVAPRRLRSAVLPIAGVAVAVLVLAAACGPVGGDEDEKPTPRATVAAGGAASPVRVAGTPGTPRPRATARAVAGTPLARPTQTPSPRPTSAEPTAVPETPAPPAVEGCEEPAELPAVQGASLRRTTDEGVRLRAGPGTDCDQLAELAAGTEVEVLSGPVSAGDRLWVKVTAEGTEGWVAEEFLAPVEDEAA